MERELAAKTADQLLLYECATGDIGWWTTALDTLAAIETEEPLMARVFMDTLASVIPGIERARIGDVLLMDLSLGEKCYVAAALDSFMDIWVCTRQCSLSEFLDYWARTSTFLTTAGNLVRADSSHIDAGRLAPAWNALRAAVS